METIQNPHHNLFRYVIDRMYGMYKRPDHTLGDFLLLYGLIFGAILVLLVIVSPAL